MPDLPSQVVEAGAMSRADHAAAEAAREAAEAIREISARRRFTVSKFARHQDGYLHARVIVDGQRWYFHCRYGSWLAPGQIGTRTVLREPEGLLGQVIGREVKYTLAEKARSFKDTQPPPGGDSNGPEPGTASNDAPGSDDRLPERADHRDADQRPVQAD
jgi:hypothetical protein